MKKVYLMLALSLILILSACGVQAPNPDNSVAPPEPTAQAEPALSSFSTVDIEGNEQDEKIFADYDLTMINIWATFCSPCLNELPDLGALASEYADKRVRIVGIVIDIQQNADGSFDQDMINTARELVSQTGADYLHLLPSADLVAAKLGMVNAVPETIFVDSEGKLVGKSYIGSKSKEKWAAIIDELLAQTQAI